MTVVSLPDEETMIQSNALEHLRSIFSTMPLGHWTTCHDGKRGLDFKSLQIFYKQLPTCYRHEMINDAEEVSRPDQLLRCMAQQQFMAGHNLYNSADTLQ